VISIGPLSGHANRPAWRETGSISGTYFGSFVPYI